MNKCDFRVHKIKVSCKYIYLQLKLLWIAMEKKTCLPTTNLVNVILLKNCQGYMKGQNSV